MIKQVLYEMKHQPVIGCVTVIGTALAMLLIMAVVMMQEVKVLPLAPESCRDNLLIGKHVSLESGNGDTSSGDMSLSYARSLYDGLPHVDAVAYIENEPSDVEVAMLDDYPVQAHSRGVDGSFWKIFDHTFLYGRPFTDEEAASGVNVAVITEQIARDVFGESDVVGKNITIGYDPYEIVGVVEDVSTLANNSYSQIYVPYVEGDNTMGEFFGSCEAILLVDDMDYADEIREVVKNRVNAINTGLKKSGDKVVYLEAPYDQATSLAAQWSNCGPDETEARMRMFIYVILLIIPAINLSSMTHSRLRRRVAEIGVRRAFGCKRIKLLGDILLENLLITLAGGAIGLLLSIVFAILFSDLYMMGDAEGARLSFSMFFRWQIFGWALLFCLILNLLSSGIPAYRASRINPAEAIGGINK